MDSRRLADLLSTTRSGHIFSTRRAALGLSLGGVVGGLSHMDAARKKRKKDRKNKNKAKDKGKKKRCPKPKECPVTPENPCAGKNWCIDRSQTCGAQGGYGKCLVEASGGNICAEILYQTDSCANCDEPSCVDCVCALATGGGDRCNNGVNGMEFLCVRTV